MILQALHDLYERKKDELPPEGFEHKEIPFLLIINGKGEFIALQDTRSKVGKKTLARKFMVPKEQGRSGKNAWQISNLLWDHYGYVLGWPKTDSQADKDMALKQHGTFKDSVELLREKYHDNEDFDAIYTFITSGSFDKVFNTAEWNECKKIPGCNLTFLIEGRRELVCENEDIRSFVSEMAGEPDDEVDPADSDTRFGICLITGENNTIARKHPRTPIAGAKSNAKIVSFQKNKGYDSYGKEQSYNAPVSRKAAFAYTTALNFLLAKESKQKLPVGDATTVFWAEKKHPIEDVFADIFGEPAKDNPVQDCKAIIAKLRAPYTGVNSDLDPQTTFYVLGLAPNAARIAVRFWYTGSVKEVADNIWQHFEDCTIVHGPNQPETLSLFRLLISTAVQGKSENIQPHLAGEFMRAILAGTPYPYTLLSSAVQRIRAEREITYPRVSLIKAVLSRDTRYHHRDQKEVGMALDVTNRNIGYRMGRLFAVLEKIQEEASPGINATIRDRFYGAASGTPVAAFPHLMKLKNHHLSKLENRGRAVNFERLISEIMEEITEFPTHLSLPDQGRFAVGYYHQRQDFFTKKDIQ